MFFNIHLVSYFIDEDAGMFLLRCNPVLILSKKKKEKKQVALKRLVRTSDISFRAEIEK